MHNEAGLADIRAQGRGHGSDVTINNCGKWLPAMGRFTVGFIVM